MEIWKRNKYKNLTLVITGILLAVFLHNFEPFNETLFHLSRFGYLGAFLGGMLFALTFSVATGLLIISSLAQEMNPLVLASIAALGAMTGDMLIFKFVRDDLMEEIYPIYEKMGGGHVNKLLYTPYFRWTLPLLGALMIATPLPDEVGVSLMSISKMKQSSFILISLLLHFAGISLIIFASSLIK